jgi:hypothetical protein
MENNGTEQREKVQLRKKSYTDGKEWDGMEGESPISRESLYK